MPRIGSRHRTKRPSNERENEMIAMPEGVRYYRTFPSGGFPKHVVVNSSDELEMCI